MKLRDVIFLAAAGLGIWVAVRSLTKDAAPERDFGDFVAGLPPLGNPISRTVDRAGAAVTGDKSWSLGVAVYDWLNPPEQSLAAQLADLRSTGQFYGEGR